MDGINLWKALCGVFTLGWATGVLTMFVWREGEDEKKKEEK